MPTIKCCTILISKNLAMLGMEKIGSIGNGNGNARRLIKFLMFKGIEAIEG